jgi:hypothetical protein
MSVEDTVSFLSEEDSADEKEVIDLDKPKSSEKKSEPATKVKSKDKDSDDSDDDSDDSSEEKSIEDDLEDELNDEELDETDDELELVAPVRRKEILTKYPDLFKDFPYLQKAYYREQKYSEILPTIEDAQVAVGKAELLDTHEQELISGSTESILVAVRDGDKEAFAKIVDNYLPTLFKVDEGAYYHTIGNIIKHTITSMVRDGKDNQSDELIQAAEALNHYIFGTKTFTPPARMSKSDLNPEDSRKESQISEREQRFVEHQYESAKSSVVTRIDNVIKSTIDKNIDPNDSMTDYVRKNAAREVIESLDDMIGKDKRFSSIYDRLWEKAANDDFSSESMDRIKSAYLSKAKTLLPDLIKRSRNEALKGLSRRANNNDNGDKDKKGPLPVGKTRSTASSSNSGKTDNRSSSSKSLPKGMTSLEYLMSD